MSSVLGLALANGVSRQGKFLRLAQSISQLSAQQLNVPEPTVADHLVQQDNAKSGHSATAGQQCHMYCRTLPASSLTVQRQPLKLSIREALLSSSIGFRHLSGTSAESMSEGEYHHIADHLLDELHEKLEAYVADLDLDGSDIEYGQGVLTVKLGDKGTYVINKQAPNKQIWWSSPLSGPLRFDYVPSSKSWQYSRDGRELLTLLESEITQLCGTALHLK